MIFFSSIKNYYIFAIEEPMRLDVPNFRQDWEPWKTQNYAFTSEEIQMKGCALTSLAMVLKYYGVDTNPGLLNEWLKENGGYSGGGIINWAKAVTIGEGISYHGIIDFAGAADLDFIKNEINNGYPVIARMGYKGTSHYVVICGYQQDTFFVNDPWYEDPGHTINSIRMQGDMEVMYDDFEDARKAIKGIVVIRSNKPLPPKVPVINIKSSLPGYPDIILNPIKMPKMEFYIGQPYIYVNGIKKNIDNEGTCPQITEGRTLLPIRKIIEEMGGTVEWDAKQMKVTINVQGRYMEIWIGRRTGFNNYWYFEFDVPPQIINGRTMCPVRIISEQLGCKVDWNDSEKKVTIYSE